MSKEKPTPFEIKGAVEDLVTIEHVIKILHQRGRVPLIEAINKLHDSYNKLIEENNAHTEALEILNSLRDKDIFKDDDE